jgi:uncharacterized membrane protein (GlpM family)
VDIRLLSLYFIAGGSIVALVSHFGSQGKGLLAAFVAFIPSITVITLCTIYFRGGISAATSYVKGMLLLLPAWTLYALCLFYLLPWMGLVPALVISISIYLVASFLTLRLTG